MEGKLSVFMTAVFLQQNSCKNQSTADQTRKTTWLVNLYKNGRKNRKGFGRSLAGRSLGIYR